MYDKIEDVVYLFNTNLKAVLSISFKGDNEKYPSINTYSYNYGGKSKNGLRLSLNTGLNLEYSRFNQDTRLKEKSSVYITELNWYEYISGLVNSVKLFDKIIIYEDKEPYINNEVKTKYIKIGNLSQGSSLIIVPSIHENINPRDELNDTPTYYTGFEVYVNNPNNFSFIEEKKFKSFVYMMEKYSLVSESRLLFNNALLINELGL